MPTIPNAVLQAASFVGDGSAAPLAVDLGAGAVALVDVTAAQLRLYPPSPAGLVEALNGVVAFNVDGVSVALRAIGATHGAIGTRSPHDLHFIRNDVAAAVLSASRLAPATDSGLELGSGAARWGAVYAVVGAFTTGVRIGANPGLTHTLNVDGGVNLSSGNAYALGGVQRVTASTTVTTLHAGDGRAALTLASAASGGAHYHNAEAHYLRDSAGTTTFAIASAAGFSVVKVNMYGAGGVAPLRIGREPGQRFSLIEWSNASLADLWATIGVDYDNAQLRIHGLGGIDVVMMAQGIERARFTATLGGGMRVNGPVGIIGTGTPPATAGVAFLYLSGNQLRVRGPNSDIALANV